MNFLSYVNKDKGIVAIKADNAMEELYNEYFEFFYKYGMPMDRRLFEEFSKKYEYRINKIVGLADCNYEHGDVFDVELGTKLAKERYMKTFESYRYKMYNMILEKNNAFATHINKRLDTSANRRKDRYDNIDEIISKLREND